MATKNACPLISLPSEFNFDQVDGKYIDLGDQPSDDTSLGPLDAFNGSFVGTGFNAIFRPNSSVTPAHLKNEVIGIFGLENHTKDNILELNVTKEALTFTQKKNISHVPNRGEGSQGQIFLAGVAYLQVVSDTLNPSTGKADGKPVGIHLEPGLWMQVPASQHVEPTLTRMGSIPHGVTINASGPMPQQTQGGPDFNAPNLLPSLLPINVLNHTVDEFQQFSLDVTYANSPRHPQDLSKFVQTNTITQAMLNNPLTVLENANQGKTILQTYTLTVSATQPGDDGSGIVNIAFLQGNILSQNARVTSFTNTFWIETVQYHIDVPVSTAGQHLHLHPSDPGLGSPAPKFLVIPPQDITQVTTITVTSTQIQTFQRVILVFSGLAWPHISVGTLVPEEPIEVPSSAFESTT